MNIADAWSVLGKNWADLVRDLAAMPTDSGRVQHAEQLLAEARKIARKLMAKHHPDMNQDDPDSAIRFQAVSAALSAIEASTNEMLDKYQESKLRAEQLASKRAKDGFIVIK